MYNRRCPPPLDQLVFLPSVDGSLGLSLGIIFIHAVNFFQSVLIYETLNKDGRRHSRLNPREEFNTLNLESPFMENQLLRSHGAQL